MKCRKRDLDQCFEENKCFATQRGKRNSYCRKYSKNRRSRTASACRGRALRDCHEKDRCIKAQGNSRSFCRKYNNKRKTSRK